MPPGPFRSEDMGVNLTPIIVKKVTTLDALRGRTMAVDAFNVLYQFLALIRTRTGTPLTDGEGHVTSHLVGLAFRTTRLITDYNITPVFVFDGKPPDLKKAELEARGEKKRQAEKDYIEAVEKGDFAVAWRKAVQTSRLSYSMVDDAKHLMTLLGVPWVQAPSEGEAQAAYMAIRGDVWAASSRDYDSLLFGAPRVVRYLTIQGQEWLPSRGRARKLEPEIIDLAQLLAHLGLTREQLIDASLLIGTDFNPGIKGIGPKTAVKLMKKHGSLENLPGETREKLTTSYPEIREFYLNPPTVNDYSTQMQPLKREELYSFLCDERDFSRDRVNVLVKRLEQPIRQRSLAEWVKEEK